MNDCKYGYDIHDGVMRLTLLKSPTFPNAADKGYHEFTYSFLPHKGTYREGQVQKVPYLLVVGFNEKDDRTVSFRLHGEKETTVLPLDEFVEKIKAEIAEKSKEHIHVN